MNIVITEKDRAQNVAFQIKQLMVTLSTQIKPQADQALIFLKNGTEGMSASALEDALGKKAKTEILSKLEAVSNALN